MLRYSYRMAEAWQNCDRFNRQYPPGNRMTLSYPEEPSKTVTLVGEAYALPNGNPVVQIKEQVYPVAINQLAPI